MKKRIKIITLISIVLVIIIIGLIIGVNILRSNLANENYNSANSNSNNGSLIASNIKAGITIGGVTGTLKDIDTSDATATAEDILYGKTAYVNGVKITGTYVKREYISKTTSYVGCYADIDGDGTADGIIYADLCIGGSGQWKDSDGIYNISKASNTKDYYIKNESYSAKLGTRKLIAREDSSSGNEDRFYVMALSDIDSNYHYWYYSAYGKINDYSTLTSVEFGTGRQNTQNIMNKWNSSSYGTKNSNDLWGLIQEEVNKGWFVPSRGELAAYIMELNISTLKYYEYMSSVTASSSLASPSTAWNAHWGYQSMAGGYINGSAFYVRLSTTF